MDKLIKLLRIGLYARVSSDGQRVDSQVADLLRKILEDGGVLLPEHHFIDDGYSGESLLRPGLERLRDQVVAGLLDRIYVLAPDRLSRNFVHLMLLHEEFARYGVEIVYLNRPLGNSAEDVLLGQIQAAVAEFERAKILDRGRRGRLNAARQGRVNVLSGAPFGYRYIDTHTGGGQARYEIAEPYAGVVREIFRLVGEERWTLRRVCKHLQEKGVPTPGGSSRWSHKTVLGLLRNPAYKGQAGYGKTQSIQKRPQLRPARGRSAIPRRARTTTPTPERAISIPVPALVSEELFAAVSEQLAENRRRQRERQEAGQHRYLLSGLVECAKCKYSYYGKPAGARRGQAKRKYDYYRCAGSDGSRFGGERACDNRPMRSDVLEDAVWQDVCALLRHPQMIEKEYRRRKEGEASKPKGDSPLKKRIRGLEKKLGRLIDSYTEELITKEEFASRSTGIRSQLEMLRKDEAAEEARTEQIEKLGEVVECLEAFSAQVRDNLETLDGAAKREIVRKMVRKVVIDHDEVSIVFRVDLPPFDGGPTRGILQDWYRPAHAAPLASVFLAPSANRPAEITLYTSINIRERL